MNHYILKQLPIIPKQKYKNIEKKLLDHILDLILNLTYTTSSLTSFAADVGCDKVPFRWDSEEREQLKAELDAITAHLYGVSREELDYILETFPIVKRNYMDEYGEYRTKRLILEYYDKYADRMNEVKK